jgi:1-acyl-sn-glycerol-3-phosphate acyltransferase
VRERVCVVSNALRGSRHVRARSHPPQVRGAENLPKDTEPAVYVANHQSYLDIYSLFHLRRPFKVRACCACRACVLVARACATVLQCAHPSALTPARLHPLAHPQFISKTSNFLIPIIGWSMYLTGHVPLKRMDRRSQMARAPARLLRAGRGVCSCAGWG